MARSLLIMLRIHCERPPVYSVTSEAASNVPFQSTPPRPARSDPNQGNDIFGALVDNNTANDNSNANAPAPPQPAWQQRSDNSPAPANDGGSQNATAAGQSASNDSNNPSASTGQPSNSRRPA